MKNKTLSQRFLIFAFALLFVFSAAGISTSAFMSLGTAFALGQDKSAYETAGNGDVSLDEAALNGDICLDETADCGSALGEKDAFAFGAPQKTNTFADTGEFEFDESANLGGAYLSDGATPAADKSWGGKTASDLWYYGEKGLNLAALKKTISGWHLAAPQKGKELVIAVVDTGINVEHELFKDVLLRNPEGLVYGYNSYLDNGDIADTDSKMHGTAVAGIIAMMIHELGLEDYVKIYPIKASYGKTTSYFNIKSVTRAINRAADVTRGFNVVAINLSFGIQKGDKGFINWDNDPGLLAAINKASRTTNIIAAAGNKGVNSNDNPFYPAVLGGVASVMAYGNDNDGEKLDMSNYGDEYKLIAPGKDIWTAKTGKDGAVSYQSLSGTSMASPFVAMSSALTSLRFQKDGIRVDAFGKSRVLRKCVDGDIKYKEKSGKEYSLKKLSINSVLTKNVTSYIKAYDLPSSLKILASTDNKTETDDLGGKRFVVVLGELLPFQLNASVQPFGDTDPDYETIVEWYMVDSLGDKFLGRGRTFTFAPTIAGEFTIYAKLKVNGEYLPDMLDKDMIKIRVQYRNYLGDEVKITLARDARKKIKDATDDIKVYTTETIELGLTGLLYVDRTKEVKWYVNGEYAASGYTFIFSPEKVGKYKIYAEYCVAEDETKRVPRDLILDVKLFIARPCDIFTLAACGIILIGAATVAIAINGLKKKKTE